ncbi:MAG: cysteine hydrolase [Candidatus Bathyarchaeota archaeon]|nr:cysteine hydrolase [Candidatus Bathyarchaeota archaeon]MDH5746776.1 cysteine hydrolase [Candidatus Bathyarchaeota archaeon]
MNNKAVLIIDMLNDFVTGDLKCERAKHIIPNLKKLIEAARKHNISAVYCNDAHYPEDFEVVEKWGKHAVKGTKGAEVIPELKPSEKDYIVEKRTYSCFYETGLDPLLRSLYKGEGVKTVILGGLHTNICVRHTAAGAFFRGYKILIAKDGVEAFTKEDHEQGLKYLESVYNAKIKTVDEIIKEFG